ncbi:MAG TPA: DUF892 family protein [Planctomycetota bacterium]|nr:DUF892 family protein [Planctomycetota bacterium]
MKKSLNAAKFEELLLQALETELGGVQVYETALRCATQPELREEWEKYHEQTEQHVEKVREVCAACGVDPERETPGRAVVRHLGESLVAAMEMAIEAGDPEAAQVVACECVVLAETKDHANWELLGEALKELTGDARETLKEAHEEIEEQEDEHYYHTRGWCRELWIKGLGLPAVVPPPEEQKDVKTAIGAARAKASREAMT